MSKKTMSYKKTGRCRSNTIPTRPRPEEVVAQFANALLSAGCPGDVVVSLRPRLLDLLDVAERATIAAERASKNTSRSMAIASSALSKVTFLLGVLESINHEHPGLVRRHLQQYRTSFN